MKSIKPLIFLLAILLTANGFAQTTQRSGRTLPKGSLTSGTIDSQFVYLYAISRSQDGFELIRPANLNIIRKNVADSINVLTQQINEFQTKQGHEQGIINAITDTLTQVRNELRVAQDTRDNFSFIGISLQKGTYSLMMWGIVLLLAISLTFYVYRFNQSHVVTKDSKKAIDDLQTEFDKHRKFALEKEQKLKRQLQDEINRRHG